jgi:hypothetical protein
MGKVKKTRDIRLVVILSTAGIAHTTQKGYKFAMETARIRSAAWFAARTTSSAQRERMMITPNACRARELYDAAGPAQQAGIFGSGRQTGQ